MCLTWNEIFWNLADSNLRENNPNPTEMRSITVMRFDFLGLNNEFYESSFMLLTSYRN